MHVTAAPVTASPAQGYESLEDEVRIDSVPVTGEVPAWLTGSRYAYSSAPPSQSRTAACVTARVLRPYRERATATSARVPNAPSATSADLVCAARSARF